MYQIAACVLRCNHSFPEICIVSQLVSGAEKSRNCQHFIWTFTEKSAQPAAEMEGCKPYMHTTNKERLLKIVQVVESNVYTTGADDYEVLHVTLGD